MFKSGNVTVMVSDLEKSVDFYTKTLGFKLEFHAKGNWATITAPGITIGLHPASEHGPRPGNSESLSIGLEVEDLSKTVGELKGKGIKFGYVIDDKEVKLVNFKDPDNNPLYLAQVVI